MDNRTGTSFEPAPPRTTGRYDDALQRYAASPDSMTVKLQRTAEREGPLELSSALIHSFGQMPVTYTDYRGGTRTRGLDRIPAGTRVTAVGVISEIRVHGDDDAPRATFRLDSSEGDRVMVAAATEQYLDFFGWLLEGRKVCCEAHVKRPFEAMPAFLQAVSVFPQP